MYIYIYICMHVYIYIYIYTGLSQPFEIAMVAWKSSLLAFGIFKATRTWEVPEEISEAKYFAIAIYNIAVVGCFTYFLSVFGEADVNSVVVLRVIGLFISATVSAVVIMLPKLVIIQLSWTEVFLGSASSFKEDCSYTSSIPPIIGPTVLIKSQKNRHNSRHNLDLNLENVPVRKYKEANIDDNSSAAFEPVKQRQVLI
jgi:hypothetical protein